MLLFEKNEKKRKKRKTGQTDKNFVYEIEVSK